jgi:uncharacterized protein (DUF1810 family)
MTDPYNLQRFVEAHAPVYADVVRELAAGRKESHWIWFVFPQIAGLGMSSTSVFISSLDEASAYLAHPILGPRLLECAGLVANTRGRTARQIFGSVDEMKFRSSMTLFARAAPGRSAFAECLERFFAGGSDPATLEKLSR